MFVLVLATRVRAGGRAGNKPCIVRILFGESSGGGIQLAKDPEKKGPGEGRRWWITRVDEVAAMLEQLTS